MEKVKKSNQNKPSTSSSVGPSKKSEKLPESKASKSVKSKTTSNNSAADHSYAEKRDFQKFEKVKVRVRKKNKEFS